MHRLGMHATTHTHMHTHTYFNYCMHYVHKHNQAVFRLIHLTNTATFAVYIFQVFTNIQQLRSHCDSSFAFISIHFGICFHFYLRWVCVFVYQYINKSCI